MTITVQEQEQEPRTIRLSPAEYTATAERLAKINARAERRGFTGRWVLTGERKVVTTNENGFMVEHVWMDATLTGEAPSYGGWTFLAALDWDPNAGLVVRAAPGVEQVDRSGLVEGQCQHCNTVRRNRRKTYVVTDGTTTVQVGSTCLKDFLGWDGRVAWITEKDEEEVDDLFGGTHWGEPEVTVDTALGLAWASIQASGWRPASSWGATTRGDVETFLFGRGKPAEQVRADLAPFLNERTEERAAEVKAFILSDDFAGASDYVTNLKAVIGAESGFVSARNLGLVVSAPQAHARHVERTLIREKAKALPSRHIGVVKGKITFTGTIVGIRYIEGVHGTTVLYTLVAEDGVQVKWFASRSALGEQEGREVTITATVKAHDQYQGVPQTVVTRAKEVTQ